MKVTFKGTIHEILNQIEDFCSGLIKATPEPKPAKPKKPRPQIEQVIDPVVPDIVIIEPAPKLAVPEDLLGAVMALVNGDKEKKAKLVAILAEQNAKTIGALNEDQRVLFWAEVSRKLA